MLRVRLFTFVYFLQQNKKFILNLIFTIFSLGNGGTPGAKERLLESLPDCTEFEIEGCARTGNSTTIIIPSQNSTTLVITNPNNNLTDQNQILQIINSTTVVISNQNADSATLVPETLSQVDSGNGKGAFINDVTQILNISDPPSPLCHAKMTILLTTFFILSQKSDPPPSCVTSFMNVPYVLFKLS